MSRFSDVDAIIFGGIPVELFIALSHSGVKRHTVEVGAFVLNAKGIGSLLIIDGNLFISLK